MSWVRIWVHLVFTTMNRESHFKSKEARDLLFQHILVNCREKRIKAASIGGYVDHIHCLLSLDKEMSMSKIVQLIKGESSHWINENKLIAGKFLWQDDYWAVSVSESHVAAVKKYIESQEEHHRKKSFGEEVEEFRKKYGGEYIEHA